MAGIGNKPFFPWTSQEDLDRGTSTAATGSRANGTDLAEGSALARKLSHLDGKGRGPSARHGAYRVFAGPARGGAAVEAL